MNACDKWLIPSCLRATREALVHTERRGSGGGVHPSSRLTAAYESKPRSPLLGGLGLSHFSLAFVDQLNEES